MTELLFVLMFVSVCFIQDIDHLQEVWEITQEWNANWNKWKTGQFATLQTEDMESIAQDMFKKLHKLQRELKVSSAIVTFGFLGVLE